MAHGLNPRNSAVCSSLFHNWSTTGAKEAGRQSRAPLCAKNGGKPSAPVRAKTANNWSTTGANWSSNGASAPVVYTPLKGGYKPNWSSTPVHLQNWRKDRGT